MATGTPADVRAVADVRVRGRDGRLYRAHPLDPGERDRAIGLAHELVHGRRMSVRAARQVMSDTYGLRRSVGAISADLARYVCDLCEDT